MLEPIKTLRVNDLINASKDGENITVIINGLYYNLDVYPADDTNKAFLEGVRFAAAVIEDYITRMDYCRISDKQLKRDLYAWQRIKQNTKSVISHLEYITQPDHGLETWKQEFYSDKLWRMKT